MRAAFDLQGHRGARGLAPENTLAGFEVALGLGVTTLETDLGVTRDGVVVLHHDISLNPATTRDASGSWLAGPGALIRDLTFDQLQAYDVGRIDPACAYSRQFPRQVAVDGARVPRLGDLFRLGEASGKQPRYNIEIKASPLRPDGTLPPGAFAALVIADIRAAGLQDRVTVQAFDWAVLAAVKAIAADIATVALSVDTREETTVRGPGGAPSPWLAGLDIANPDASVPALAAAAGAAVWSPYWRNVDAASVGEAHALGLAVIPWTVNEPADMAAVIALGIDGLITDYPDRALALLEALRV